MNWWPKLVFLATLGNIIYLSLLSLLPSSLSLDSVSVWGLRIVAVAGVAMALGRYHKLMDAKWEWRQLWIFLPYIVILLLRFPLLYPTYDDLAAHFMWGDYANRIWQNSNYMPLEFLTYFYLPYDMNYTPFLYLIGARLTIGLFFVVTTVWLMSLYLRLRVLCNNELQRLLLSLLFVMIPLIPHMMAIQGTLMLEYFTLPFVLEALYQCLAPGKNKTFAVMAVLAAVLIKQSHAVFVGLPLLYFVVRDRKKINWTIPLLAGLVAGLFFVRLQVETGNLLSGLFNGVFQSSLYHESNFSNPLFGPDNWIETVLWPVIGQFTERYAEGIVATPAKIIFAPIAIIPYLLSLYIAVKRRSLLWGLVFISYLLWSQLVGYARYYLALNIMALIMIIVVEGNVWKMQLKGWMARTVILLVMILSLSSFKTDFSWRPNPSLVTRAANDYYLTKYQEGMQLLGRDTTVTMARQYSDLFAPYEAVLTVYRGPVTMFSYMGYLNGLPVYTAVTEERYKRVVADTNVSDTIKSNLQRVIEHKRILMVVDNYFIPYTTEWYTDHHFDCKDIGPAPSDGFLQRPDYYSETTMYDCRRI